MELLIILLLFFLSFILFVIEVFLTPGLGFAGFLSAGCLLVGNLLTFIEFGTLAGLWVVGASFVCCFLLIYWAMHSKMLDKVSLHKSIDSTSVSPEQLSVKVGDVGIAQTRLALVGNARIDKKVVEVKSVDGFIDEGSPIIVVDVQQALILVKKNSDFEY